MVLAPTSCTDQVSQCFGFSTIEQPTCQLPASSICFVAINGKSGAKYGKVVRQWVMERYPRAVILALGSPTCVQDACLAVRAMDPQQIESLSDTGSNRPTMLVGGGDGTLAWALAQYIVFRHQLDADMLPDLLTATEDIVIPKVALMPIGIGNELARCLGWGSGFRHNATASIATQQQKLDRHIATAISGSQGWLDEWMVKTSGPAIAVGGEPDPARGHVCCRRRMLCFMSIGFLDSAISHEFSTLRDGNPSVFGAWTVVNKAAYAYLGLKKGIADVLPPVRDHLRLEVDGETIELPPSITTVQILNCHSSADGLDFWGTKESSLDTELQQFEPPHLADGLLEVVGTEGLVHMLSVRMRLRHSIRLAQGKSIRITMATKHPGVLSEHNSTATLAAQIDGESWVPTNGEVITLEHTQKLPVVFGWESLFNAGPCS
eukprot:m.1137029 g.1137029  ORF g.1137029 m.1137029 type:complete len:434 (-) comp24434_c2_seq4:374-1675(-)